MYINIDHLKQYDARSLKRNLSKPEKVVKWISKILDAGDIEDTQEFDDYQTSVFLCHKHDESDILELVSALLKSLNVKVYIDWKDASMPAETSAYTAEMIKNKISDCSKFIFLATKSGMESKWCNWELGFGDSVKFPSNIAVMPIADHNGDWHGSEYLDIYPIIQINRNFQYEVDFEDTRVDLASWLTDKKIFNKYAIKKTKATPNF